MVKRSREMPGFIRPQLAMLKAKAANGNYLHEIKYDGYRVQLDVNDGKKKKAYTGNGLNWTKRFSVIAGALNIPGQAIIDGEVVVIHEGRTNFSELQADLASGSQGRLLHYASTTWLDGKDLRRTPQLERKALLKELFDTYELEPPVLYSEHIEGDGQELFEHASKLNDEGIISKKADAPYRSDRNDAWLKIKAVHKGEFPVVGFIKDPSGVAALKEGGKGPRLCGQGRHGLESHYLGANPQGA